MYGLLVCALFVAPQQDPTSPPKPGDRDATPKFSLDGNWSVLSAEKEGQPMPDAKKMTATIANNTVTCNSDSKHDMKTMRLEFGPQATIRVMEMNERGTVEKTRMGVYVLTKDILAICLHDTPATTTSVRPDGERTSLKIDGQFTATPHTKSNCTIVLRRADKTDR